MGRFFALVYIGVLLWPSATSGTLMEMCLLHGMKREINRTITRRTEDRIGRIFANQSLTENEQAAQAYEAYLEARLRQLPPKIAEKIRDAERNSGMVYTHLPRVSGVAGHKAYEVNLLPELKGTAVEFMVRIHELEHLIARAKGITSPLREGIAAPPSGLFDRITGVRWTAFMDETQAIRAEFEYIRLLPQSQKNALYDLAVESRVLERIPKGQREMLAIWLKGSDGDFKEFLKKHHQTYRYNFDSYGGKNFRIRSYATTAIALSSVAYLRILCEVYDLPPEDLPNSVWQAICKYPTPTGSDKK